MKKFIYLLGFFVAAGLIAQDKKAIKFASTITAEDLKEHLSILASDEYEGRETGQKGQKMAAEYIANYFKKLGLKPPVNGSYFQSFDLTQSTISTVYFKRDGEVKKAYKDFVYYSKSETFGEEYIKVVVSKQDDSNKEDYRGAYVLFQSEALGGLQERIDVAKEIGAKGFIVALQSDDEFQSTLGRFGPYLQRPSLDLLGRDNNTDKMIIVDKKMVSWIFEKDYSRIKEGEKTTIIFNADYLDKPVSTENVLGFLKGAEKSDEILVITSHYDHIGIVDGEINNGADDDGSGTVSLLEIAEAFSLAAKRSPPKRSILFMAVTGEEKGLLGSKYYTDIDPVFPLENIVTNLNIDMVGRVDEKHEDNPNYIYLIGSDKLSQELHDISEEVNKAYIDLELDYTYNDENDPNRFYYRSDHYNFAKNNIPIIFYFNGTHEDYHKPSDTVEKIQFDKMEKIARLVFHTGWEVVNREEKVKLNQERKMN